jgi:hypothetical protein
MPLNPVPQTCCDSYNREYSTTDDGQVAVCAAWQPSH